MKFNKLKNTLLIAAFVSITANFAFAQTQKAAQINARINERDVRAEMGFLASDALSGRGSGTQFELLAAQYIGSQLQQFGVEAAGDIDVSANGKTYIQTVNITKNAFAANPQLTYNLNGAPVILEHGKEMIVARLNAAQINGSLQKMTLDENPKPGAVVFIKPRNGEDSAKMMQNVQSVLTKGAAAVIIQEMPSMRAQWENIAARRLSFTDISGGAAMQPKASGVIIVSKAAALPLSQTADGTPVEIKGTLGAPQMLKTWNAVGKITGTDARLTADVILLSAHLDHLGVRENAPGTDKIFNGADDDASGCVAVLELARVLANGQPPKRTVYFAFFGSEEAGGYGAQYFVNNLPFQKVNLTANLEFEMIGRPDAKVSADQLWLTGYERSNLGAELAKRGCRSAPGRKFFPALR